MADIYDVDEPLVNKQLPGIGEEDNEDEDWARPTSLVFGRMPETDDELWEWVKLVWDFEIPRVSVCPDHCAPFDAFADAYFARSSVAIWKASRGLGGKSTLLGILSLTEAVTLGAQITVLGGSAAQSQRVHEVTKEAWFSEWAPSTLLKGDPTQFVTNLTNGSWIRALMASQTSVRGPHPQRLRLDEIDEMDLPILEAAQGQPMETSHKNEDGDLELDIPAHTVMSSTHQYPDKTMTTMIRRAGEKGWPLFTWCYRENLETGGGWLTQRAVDKKRNEVSTAMWDIEFELQEPSFEGRAIDADLVEACFNVNLGRFDGALDENIEIEAPVLDQWGRPDPTVVYVTGVDWAKERDFTVISTFRATPAPWICVAFRRTGRKPWPLMVGHVDDRLDRFGGLIIHDATGLGSVVSDMLSVKPIDFVMNGAARTNMFSDYVKAVENQEIQYPRIEYAYTEHKYAAVDDLYGNGHPPDSIVAGGLAWAMRRQVYRYSATPMPVEVAREGDTSPWRSM
jgi:hypothetical protein